ncbi:hypothetical protein [Polynucleobacter sp. UB-Piko-W3]|uniref:hypothetical protein n=1 Tax=Polynucleobacter sp. UB-Piko-W3 TaxID=1819735 RepID=UPI001C0B227D|nr:hypothetical protein [Polynucleobacter sp. UB-Piko-W3]MBU3554836.1 hypothetical protein [Polynucleobacter sp. UB-Piko-W3]
MGGSSGGGFVGSIMSAVADVVNTVTGEDGQQKQATDNATTDNSVADPVDNRTPEQIAADNAAADVNAGNANPETKKKSEGKALPGALGRDE